MRRKVLILLVAGVLLSGLSGIGIYLYVGALEHQLAGSRDKLRRMQADMDAIATVVEVPVLKADVAQGGAITFGGLEMARVSLAHMPADVLRDATELLGADNAPQTVIAGVGMTKGQVLLRSHILLPDTRRSGTIMVPLGHQVFPLRAANLADYQNRLKPGDSVDVFWRTIDRKGNRTTRFLVAGMQVAQVKPAEGDGAAPVALIRPESIFLVGRPEQVSLLVQTEGRGELFLAPGGTGGVFPSHAVAVDNQTLAQRPLAKEPPAGDLAAGIGQFASTGQGAAPAEVGARAGTPGLTDSGLAGLLTAEATPETCFMTVVKGSARSVIEVPCR